MCQNIRLKCHSPCCRTGGVHAVKHDGLLCMQHRNMKVCQHYLMSLARVCRFLSVFYVCSRQSLFNRMFRPLFFLLDAMAEAPKTEYVSARFRTLQAQEHTLTFPRAATLGLFFLYTHRDDKNKERQRDGEAHVR